MKTPPLFMGLPERFWCRVEVKDRGYKSLCLVWTGRDDGRGYGRYYLNGKYRAAHKVAYEAAVGPVPEGRELDHLCRVHACVNWDHLEPVTHRENTLRGDGPSARHARATHCANGHPFNAENTYVIPGGKRAGKRECRACFRIRQRAKRARRRLRESS